MNIDKKLEKAPMIREDMTIEVSVASPFGKGGIWLFINYGKDIAVKSTRGGRDKIVRMNIPKFTSYLFSIVSSWDEVMINNRVCDGLSYRVAITKEGNTREYIGQNKFPDNFDSFMLLLKYYKRL